MNSPFDIKSLNNTFKQVYGESLRNLMPQILSRRTLKCGIVVEYRKSLSVLVGDSKKKSFSYFINDELVTREEAKDYLELHSTKLAELL